MRRQFGAILLACTALATLQSWAQAAVPVATYTFGNNFLADQGSAPAIVPTDPLGTSAFVSDTVFGETSTVWAFDGNQDPIAEQAGLTVDTTGLVAPTSYSVDMVFLLTELENAWRRIIDVENRLSDSGFYVDPTNNLAIYPVAGSTAAFTTNVYHHVVLTNDGTTTRGYIDGVAQFSASTSLMNINNGNNPDELMNFFLDNFDGGGAYEFSDGRVALIRLWDGVLTPAAARAIAAQPFTIPEPTTAVLTALYAIFLGTRRSLNSGR